MESTGLKILVIDCVEKDTLPLGGVDGWFRVALAKCDPRDATIVAPLMFAYILGQ